MSKTRSIMPRTCSADRWPDGSLESPSFWLSGLCKRTNRSSAAQCCANRCRRIRRAACAAAELAQTDGASQPACGVSVSTHVIVISSPSRSRKARGARNTNDPACDEGCQRCPSSERIGNSWVGPGLPAKHSAGRSTRQPIRFRGCKPV